MDTASRQFVQTAFGRFNRRIVASDVAADAGLQAIADHFIRTYEGPIPFVLGLQRALTREGRLSDYQLSAARNIAKVQPEESR